MASVNKVILIGNVTRDPEVKYTPKGTAVAEVGIALNRIYTADNGERREETTFVDVTFWGKQAEIAGQYLTKGRPIYVEGRLQLDTWEDRQSGQKRSRLRVVGETLQFLGSRPAGTGGSGGGSSHFEESERPASSPSRPSSSRPSKPASDPPPGEDEEDDDIPF